ncbi:hypothetical protein GTH32_06175 [Alteromonas sp. 345S023]|uniref:Catalase n=1 Tax=Alteromonas profundi TaxID=2696062 RepID=A0A7X5LK09_9ALTE|nr:hypothetical protein [Alteromonas profundi]
MNIVTPIITALAYPTANVNTESARRDNVLRETIPQAAGAEQGASQKGLGSETDKARNPGQQPAPVTYERPQSQSDVQSAFDNVFGQDLNNSEQESAGKQDAQNEQQAQQHAKQQVEEQGLEGKIPEEQEEIEALEKRDAEVRTHEQAHAAAGGQYAGSPQYQYTTGPDNRSYVTDGEVSIDVSKAQTPEQTVSKMQQVRAAALAPAEPSSQDLKVAAEAVQKESEARVEIAQQKSQTTPAVSNESHDNDSESLPLGKVGETDTQRVEIPNRRLESASLFSVQMEPQSLFDTSHSSENKYSVASPNGAANSAADEYMQARISRIQHVYAASYTPSKEGFSASA